METTIKVTINLKEVLELMQTDSLRTLSYHKEFYGVTDVEKQYPVSYFTNIIGFDFINDELIKITEASIILKVSKDVLLRLGENNLIQVYTNKINRQRYVLAKDIAFLQNNKHLTFRNGYSVDMSRILLNSINENRFRFNFLSEIERKSIELLHKGLNNEEIGFELNITSGRVGQVIQKVIRRTSYHISNYSRELMDGKLLKLEKENRYLKDQISKLGKEKGLDVKKVFQDPLDNFLHTPIHELCFSVRCYNCLRAGGIEYVWQLVELELSDLLKFRNFGKKSLTELEQFLMSKNLTFGMDVDSFK